MAQGPIRVAAVAAGDRSVKYASYALKYPERMQVVAVAEPDAGRRSRFAAEHRIPAAMQFKSWEQLARQPKLADAAINGTMDRLHYDSSVALLERGYHLLLEKPIAPSEREVRDLIALGQRRERLVMICHVLRYTPFYGAIKQALSDGRLGSVVSMRTQEAVGYTLTSAAFVRGRWRRTDTATPIMLAKCCHDLDIIAWLMSGVEPVRVASFGSRTQFRPENAPPGAGTRCLVDCSIEESCPFSARQIYLNHRIGHYAWEFIEHLSNPTEQDKLASLRDESNPHGRCIWKTDADQFDHQSLIIEFANGATATHDLFCATSRKTRTIHVVGDRGELVGDFTEGKIALRRHNPGNKLGYDEQIIDVGIHGGGGDHGGGDGSLIEDFVKVLRGEPTSRASTRIEDSLIGHLLVFAANQSVTQKRMVAITVSGDSRGAAAS